MQVSCIQHQLLWLHVHNELSCLANSVPLQISTASVSIFLQSPHLIPLIWLGQLITCSWRLPKHELHYTYATVFGGSIIMSQPYKKNYNQVTNVEGVKNGLTQGSKTTHMNPMSWKWETNTYPLLRLLIFSTIIYTAMQKIWKLMRYNLHCL